MGPRDARASGCPRPRRSLATWTTNGRAAPRPQPSSWSKNPASGDVGRARRRRPAGDSPSWERRRHGLELLAPGLHRLQGALEHDLERRQALVAVVLGLVAQPSGLLAGVVEDALGHLVGLADDLGALHHALGLGPHVLEELVGLALARGEELVALAQQPPGPAQLVGEPVEGALQEVEQRPGGRRAPTPTAAWCAPWTRRRWPAADNPRRRRRATGASSSSGSSSKASSLTLSNFFSSRTATALGTKAETSPP